MEADLDPHFIRTFFFCPAHRTTNNSTFSRFPSNPARGGCRTLR